MIKNFYDLIVLRPQLKTLTQVPLIIRSKVHDMLLANGYDDNGDLIPIVVEH
jgi:hypothetical protein